MVKETIEKHCGVSVKLCDYIVKHQIEEIQPRRVVDFGAGAGKIGKICRGVLGRSVELIAIERDKKTSEMLCRKELYDEVHNTLIQDWVDVDTEVYDLAIFGDVLEHLGPKEIHALIKRCLLKFQQIIVIWPINDLALDDIRHRPLDIHRSYITTHFFDKYNVVEKHAVQGGRWSIINIRIVSKSQPESLGIRLFRFAFHQSVLVLQPIGLAGLLARFVRFSGRVCIRLTRNQEMVKSLGTRMVMSLTQKIT